MCHLSHVTCHVSHVRGHVSCVMCQESGVMCQQKKNGLNDRARRWRVCLKRSLPGPVSLICKINPFTLPLLVNWTSEFEKDMFCLFWICQDKDLTENTNILRSVWNVKMQQCKKKTLFFFFFLTGGICYLYGVDGSGSAHEQTYKISREELPHPIKQRRDELRERNFFVSLPLWWRLLILVDSCAEWGWPDTLGIIQGDLGSIGISTLNVFFFFLFG